MRSRKCHAVLCFHLPEISSPSATWEPGRTDCPCSRCGSTGKDWMHSKWWRTAEGTVKVVQETAGLSKVVFYRAEFDPSMLSWQHEPLIKWALITELEVNGLTSQEITWEKRNTFFFLPQKSSDNSLGHSTVFLQLWHLETNCLYAVWSCNFTYMHGKILNEYLLHRKMHNSEHMKTSSCTLKAGLLNMDGFPLECKVYHICNGVKILKTFIAVMSMLYASPSARTLQGHVLSNTMAQKTSKFYWSDAASAVLKWACQIRLEYNDVSLCYNVTQAELCSAVAKLFLFPKLL